MDEKRAIVVNKTHLKSPASDVVYWRSQPYEARIAALETIRHEFHQWKYPTQPEFQRSYTIVKLKQIVK